MKTRNKACRLLLLIVVTVCLISSNKLVWGNLPEGDVNGSQSADEKAYDAPDQAVWHAPSKTWFVSNLGGGISLERDNYGWITRTDAKGNITEPFWIGKKEGMHAPSGMIATDDFLYVCDRDGVHQIDIDKQKITAFYPLSGGEFINQ